MTSPLVPVEDISAAVAAFQEEVKAALATPLTGKAGSDEQRPLFRALSISLRGLQELLREVPASSLQVSQVKTEEDFKEEEDDDFSIFCVGSAEDEEEEDGGASEPGGGEDKGVGDLGENAKATRSGDVDPDDPDGSSANGGAEFRSTLEAEGRKPERRSKRLSKLVASQGPGLVAGERRKTVAEKIEGEKDVKRLMKNTEAKSEKRGIRKTPKKRKSFCKMYKCNAKDCGKVFSRDQNFKRHLLQHSQNWVCDVCDKIFRRQDYLKDHRDIHFPDKKHLCDNCPGNYASRSSLSTHRKKCIEKTINPPK